MFSELTYKQRLRRIIYFFPFRLLLLHLKKNHLLLAIWFVIFGIVTQNFATRYGVPYLFLYPEYLGQVNFFSFAIFGFALGGFITAFNLYSYIMHGFRFPFIATISKPFLKFSINNFILPVVFVITYIHFSIQFQLDKEFLSMKQITVNIFGLICGIGLFVLASFLYFLTTNKDVFKFRPKKEKATDGKDDKANPIQTTLHKDAQWYAPGRKSKSWHVETYINSDFKVMLARDSEHYDHDILTRVLSQNHINASIFEIVIIISFVALGSLSEIPLFVIPAGASFMLLCTMFLMLISAIFSWFRGWTLTILLVTALLLNFASTKNDFFRIQNHAYGLNYKTQKAEYDNRFLDALQNDKENLKNDVDHTIEILNRWRLKNARSAIERGKKPKLVLINTSGGGLRSTLWTFSCLQYADSALEGELMSHTQLITGSSGGLIGASYMRELYLQSQANDTLNIYRKKYTGDMAKDILNPIMFSITTNDLFIRYQRFSDDQYTYTKDRAYAFEKQLNENTNYLFDKRLIDYVLPEQKAEIPMMIISPTIVNDGRRLLISSQPISYLTNKQPENSLVNKPLHENIEFTRFFKQQDAYHLKFSSALRMSSTFPYILPTVSLPSEPPFDVMDAGARDNFGMLTTLQFVYTFRNWIATNTSGIVILQIRDRQKEFETHEDQHNSALQEIFSPIGSFYSNFARIHDYGHDMMLQQMSLWYNGPVDVVAFQLERNKQKDISLSWHLTTSEKEHILNAPSSESNQKALKKLRELLL